MVPPIVATWGLAAHLDVYVEVQYKPLSKILLVVAGAHRKVL